MDRAAIAKKLARLDNEALHHLSFDWPFWARPSQLAPEDRPWRYWLILAGRGFGKTRTGAEWVRQQISAGCRRIAMVGPTASDVRDTMVEGESGLLNVCPPWNKPTYQPSKRRVIWANGAVATCYSAEEPERLRGPQHDAAWADEMAAWTYLQDTWDQLQFGLRLGSDPRAVITTTPKPLPLIRQLVADPDCVTTKGSTYDNRENLAGAFLDKIIKRYEGTRLGQQELLAELLTDVPNALWTHETLARARIGSQRIPIMQRIVVGVDPSGSTGDDEGDAQGIVIAGLGVDGRGYVLADRTCKLSPEGWGRQVVRAFYDFEADRVIAEKNYGGDMVRATIQAVSASVPVELVTASRGKVLRAEPVSALYEQGSVSHLCDDAVNNPFAELEEEMSLINTTGYYGGGSPNRLDALVWALTALMLEEPHHQFAFA